MAELPVHEIQALARLCRLDLEASEAQRFAAELSKIVVHLERLSKVDVQGIAPFVGPELPAVALRPDISEAALPRQEALACVPKHDDAYVLVPRFKDADG